MFRMSNIKFYGKVKHFTFNFQSHRLKFKASNMTREREKKTDRAPNENNDVQKIRKSERSGIYSGMELRLQKSITLHNKIWYLNPLGKWNAKARTIERL